MPIKDMRTVWLVGAGFSKSLGGPLLADLFRPCSRQADHERFPETRFPQLADDLFHVRVIFNAGKREGMWADAEEFLTFVDAAYRQNTDGVKIRLLSDLEKRIAENNHSDVIPGWFWTWQQGHFHHDKLEHLDQVTRRALAAECSAFLWEIDEGDERWLPYNAWATTLKPDLDTIISFNYDLVLETVDRRAKGKLRTLLPTECSRIEGGALQGDCVPILKLHGSVDWRKAGEGEVVREEDSNVLLRSADDVPVIGTPGISKWETVQELDLLWQVAIQRLRSANALVILGYGFPASDAFARTTIQREFRNGCPDEDLKRIDFVLGPYTDPP